MRDFSEVLKKIRKESGLTQSELADVLDVSTVLIAMLETNQKEVSRGFLIKLAEKLRVEPYFLSPFMFSAEVSEKVSLSPLEKKMIDFGEKMQDFIIAKKSKNLKKK